MLEKWAPSNTLKLLALFFSLTGDYRIVPGLWIISKNVKSDRDWQSSWFVGGRPTVYFDHIYLDE